MLQCRGASAGSDTQPWQQPHRSVCAVIWSPMRSPAPISLTQLREIPAAPREFGGRSQALSRSCSSVFTGHQLLPTEQHHSHCVIRKNEEEQEFLIISKYYVDRLYVETYSQAFFLNENMSQPFEYEAVHKLRDVAVWITRLKTQKCIPLRTLCIEVGDEENKSNHLEISI